MGEVVEDTGGRREWMRRVDGGRRHGARGSCTHDSLLQRCARDTPAFVLESPTLKGRGVATRDRGCVTTLVRKRVCS